MISNDDRRAFRDWLALIAATLAIMGALAMCAPARAETGIASITATAGRTASGERFDPKGLTAAHRMLPFGTMIRVTRGEKSVVVRINDRGPFRRGRIIDLTPAAARAIGLSWRVGLARVSIGMASQRASGARPSPEFAPHRLAGIEAKSSLDFGRGPGEAVKPTVGGGWPRVLTSAREHVETLRRDDDMNPTIRHDQPAKPEAMTAAAGAAVLQRADDDAYLCDVYRRTPVKADRSGDFTWKDIFAARRLGKSVCDYAISGMAPKFRQALAAAGRAMDAAGIRWSILSGFRDDYRQRIAAGFKARTGNSLHGGSRVTCGYGCGRAVDVSDGPGGGITVASGWLARHGHRWGLRRPMPGIDPAHIQMGGGRYAATSRWAKRWRYRVASR